MPTTPFILNDPPYGTERRYNALRLAGSLSRREGEEVTDTTHRSSLEELTSWVRWADRTLVF